MIVPAYPFIGVNMVVRSEFIVIQFTKTPPRNGLNGSKRYLFKISP
ncbi:hypothetical protein [Bartonella rattaustraliani]|nr:hypothetical protein [Bartonella rattaustraliani]